MPSARRRLVLLASLALAVLPACRKEAAPPPAATPARVENAALGVAFTALPEGMRVVRNEGETLEIAHAVAGVEAPIVVTLSPKQASAINLVELSKAFQAEVVAGGGKFHGGNELVTPFGTAYTVRGGVEGGAVEERRVLMVHPGDPDRLLTFTIRYPPGDGTTARARMAPMLELVASLEPLAAGPAAPETPGAPAPTPTPATD
jgi:hypothetical protein